jgi:hypothetical protein
MLYAEFPGAGQEEVNEIHAWLNQHNWVQVHNPNDQLNNIWHGTFNRRMHEQECRQTAANAFIEASKRYCQVQLNILWAACKPVTDGLTLVG